MDLRVLDENFCVQYILDEYQSLIWTDRYNKNGDFEIYMPLTADVLEVFQNGNYLSMDESDHLMIIEDLKLTTDIESGYFITVTGRSLESILDRRIIWKQTILSKNTLIDSAIKSLLTDAIINPEISNRKISNFIYKDSTDETIQSMKLTGDIQFTGDGLYEAVNKICEAYDLGFKITLDSLNRFVFELYYRKDRSYDQSALPYVEFSPQFDNLISSDYGLVTSGYRNVTLVAGEGEGADRKTVSVYSDDFSGLDRRELYTDARDISTNTEDGEIPLEKYQEMLTNRGILKLTETQSVSDFDAKVDYKQQYKYGEDYFIGDIVQFQNALGISYRVQVTESIYSDSTNGTEQYPTFKVLEEE